MSDLQSQKVCASCNQANEQAASFCQVCGTQFQKPTFLNSGVAKTRLQEQLNDMSLSSQEQARLNVQMAVLHLRGNETGPAIEYLREAVALDSSQALTHAYLGAALAEEYLVEEAQEELELALRLDSQDAVVQLKMAEFKLRLGLSLDAVHHLELASKLPAPSRETAMYISNLLVNTRKRNKNVIERRTFLPSFKGLRFLPRPKLKATNEVEANPS